jgi:hypothetical protein
LDGLVGSRNIAFCHSRESGNPVKLKSSGLLLPQE